MPGIEYVTLESLDKKAHAWEASVHDTSENFLTKLKNPALLVIDMQRYFVDPGGRAYLPAARAILQNINALIKSFRHADWLVLFTRHGHRRGESAGLMDSWWKGRLLYEDEDQATLASELAVNPSDEVIKKQYYDAFRNTALSELLKKGNIEQLIIGGVMTDLCVETTAREAFMNGYQPVVVLDATASKTEDLHLAALKTLAHGFAYVERTNKILEQTR